MATGIAFYTYIQDQCAGLEVHFRPMMGEYLLYYREKLAGGLYDNRMMIKDVPAARAFMPEAEAEAPYPGAKEMLVVDFTDDHEKLAALLQAIYSDLPAVKKKVKKA